MILWLFRDIPEQGGLSYKPQKVDFENFILPARVPLSLIPEPGALRYEGVYVRERGMPPNGLKGPPGHDDGRGAPWKTPS